MEDYDKIKFGSLLHDVGKFTYRTHQQIKHELAGEIFNQQYIPEEISKNLIGLIQGESDWGKNSMVFSIIKIGDWLASAERTDLIDNENIDVLKKPLLSIFNQISLKESKKSTEFRYIPGPINPANEKFMPTAELTDDKTKELYKNGLWEEFTKDMEELKNKKLQNDVYFEHMLNIFKKHFCRIPSATYKSIGDISLYDHSRAACAISCALFKEYREGNKKEEDIYRIKKNISNRYQKEKLNKNKEYDKEVLKEEWFSLIHGDMSGIQKFIYTISSKDALKTLKGRSAFLVILNEFLALDLVNRLDLPRTNIILCGGGHIYILAHKKALEKLGEIRKEINKTLLEFFQGKLYLAIDGIPLKIDDFDKENFSDKWLEVSKKTGLRKRKKFEGIITDDFFKPKEIYGDLKKVLPCSICNKEVKFNKGELYYKDEGGSFKDYVEDFSTDIADEIRYCRECKSFVDFYNILRGTKLTYEKLVNLFPVLEKFCVKPNQYEFYIKDYNKIPFKFFPTVLPLKDNSVLSFEELAEQAVYSDGRGTKKIGVLKMDVDNLGKIFKDGLNKNKSISRVATLSSEISLFFEGFINELLKQEEYKNSVYLIYAGGDDTFAVGAWNKIINFAKDVYLKFREFTSYNPDITLSAGIIIVNPHYPISRAAYEAEEALEKAKGFSDNILDKNRICLFNEVFKWDVFEHDLSEFKKLLNKEDYINEVFEELNEFQIVYYLKEMLIEMINKGVSRGFLQRVKTAVKGFDNILKESIKGRIDVPKVWRLKYHIVRNYDKKNHPEVYEFARFIDLVVIHNLRAIKQQKNNQKLNLIKNVNIFSVAARIAELETKK